MAVHHPAIRDLVPHHRPQIDRSASTSRDADLDGVSEVFSEERVAELSDWAAQLEGRAVVELVDAREPDVLVDLHAADDDDLAAPASEREGERSRQQNANHAPTYHASVEVARSNEADESSSRSCRAAWR